MKNWNTKNLKRAIIPLLAMGMIQLTSCGGHALNTDAIGNFVGGDIGHGIKAGGHVIKAASYSEKDEDNLGQSVAISLTNTYPVLRNDALTKYVTLVGYTVASTSPKPEMRYVFGILDTPEVNAFSGPHGYIFITRGALENIKDEAELAGVLGHEMSHVLLHHGLNQVKSAEMNAAVSEGVQASAAAKFSQFADAGVDAITKVGYTQQQEFDADQNSVKLVIAAGYDPYSYLHFLQRLAQLQAAGGGVMSTHPGGTQRVSKVAGQLKNVPETGAILADRFAASAKM